MNLLNFLRRNAGERWKRTLYILFFAQLMTAVGFSSIFPFLPLYVQELGSSSGLSLELLAGLVYSAQAFTMMVASPFWGALADRYGRKLMVERSMFGGAALLLLMAFVTSAEQLVLLRAVQGLITGTVAAANALLASIAPRKETGFAMGMLQMGLGAGLAFGPLIGGAVADAWGYNAAFYITAAMLFGAGLLVAFGVYEKFTPSEKIQSGRAGMLAEWRHILGSAGVVSTYGLRFLTQLGRMMIIPVTPLFVQTLMHNEGQINTITGLVTGVTAATTTISAIYLGRLGDRIGHRKVVIASTLAAAALYVPQSLVTSAWQLLLFQALVGVCLGGIIPAISALLAQYSTAGEEGAVYGLDNSINAGGRSLAPLLGAAVASTFSLQATFTATAVLFLLTALFALWRLPDPEAVRAQQEGAAVAD